MAPSAEQVTTTDDVMHNDNDIHHKQDRSERLQDKRRNRLVFSSSWSESMTALSIIASELILLIIKLIYCALESIILTLIPPSEKSLEGEVILLTGAGNGIGRELAKQFVQHKVTLVCWDVDEKGNVETKRLLTELGYKDIYTYTIDISNRDKVLDTAEKVRREVGEVTVLVNNAGIMPCRPLFEQKPDTIRKIFDVNVMAHFWTLEAFLPGMIERNHGHVVALSSMCGVLGLPNVVPYCASKFAVRGMMESLYEELRVNDTAANKSQVKFTTVYPIMVNTGLVKNPRNRIPQLLDLQSPERVASKIVKAMRRNYREISIPTPLLTLDRISRLLPYKFIQQVKDFIDTGLDPDDGCDTSASK
uniref:Short-chain dehydrogenase/reductase 3 n=1 Tax=Cacopsylla melanoneura TaxID=428564 RepID=A0A8D8V0X0_9HEMI